MDGWMFNSAWALLRKWVDGMDGWMEWNGWMDGWMDGTKMDYGISIPTMQTDNGLEQNGTIVRWGGVLF